jgi:hypothetical protein
MKQLYVRVTSAEKQTYWYSDKIGQVFKVTGLHPSKRGFLVENEREKHGYWIAWEECLPATREDYNDWRANWGG